MGSSARLCLTCKVLFDSIDALNKHCALSTHPLNLHQCQSCDRAFTTPSGLQSHLDSRSHKRRSRDQISAKKSQASHDGALQPVPDVTITGKSVEDSTLSVCTRCKVTFENHQLLFEHFQTSSMHRVCTICFEVFPKKKSLKKHMAECHSQDPTPKSADRKTQITVPASAVCNPPPVMFTEPAPQPELFDDDDFVLVEKISEPSTTPILQAENVNATLPTTNFLKCPGCQIHFHPFSTLAIHIERGTCSSPSRSRQINNEMNTLAAQLLHNLSVISD